MSRSYINQKLDSYEQKIDYLNMNPFEDNLKTINQLKKELKMLISVQSSMSQRELQRFKDITMHLIEDINDSDVDLLKEYLKKKSQNSIDKKVSFLDYKYKKEKQKIEKEYEKRKKEKGGILGFGFLNRDGSRKIKESRQNFQYNTRQGPKIFTGKKSQFEQFQKRHIQSEKLYLNQRQQRLLNERMKKQFFSYLQIIDKVLKLPTLPDKIEYKSLVSMSYFENYKGFNKNAPGKNILNIGEAHYGTDNGFTQFENFIDSLVAKNKYLHECLDFIYESDLDNIAISPLFQKHGEQKITRRNVDQSSTLVTLRNFFEGTTNIKGFRAHHTDTRLTFHGLFATLINLSFKFDLDNTFNKNVLKYIYDFYKTSDDETIIQRDIFNTLLTLDTEKFYIFKLLSNKALKTALLVDNYISPNSNYDDTIKYFERKEKITAEGKKFYKMFLDSIKDFITKAVGKKLKENRNKLETNDMAVVNREMYYQYLEKKGSKRNNIEKKILYYKKFDLKFRKQMNNLDTRYFKSDPKKTIMLYHLDHIGMTESMYFYDVHTISRLFRKFDESKNRYSSCDENDKSMRNVIIYSGNNHTKNINKFLQLLPRMEVYDDRLVILNQYSNMKSQNVNPLLTSGEIGKDEVPAEIPTNFDYFNFNKKIIEKLKKDYNVRQYTQLPKAIEQEELQRQRKQKQERQRKQKQEETFSLPLVMVKA